jgi:hypothetical protein
MNNNDGHLAGIPRTLEQYAGLDGSYFISKTTLENILYDYVRRGITTNTETWTEDETQAARDLIGAVGKTDYATRDRLGVMKPGGGLSANFGQILIDPATKAQMEQGMHYSPITASGLSNAMYIGITGRQTKDYGKTYTYGNQIPLTDEEKGYALDWLGVNGKVAELLARIEALENK